ncbi:MAG: DUF5309 family protein, partial [Spirochaetaceae bacterium]|nr:DUF5309 family protein [Spirochaetaceae bacterium]
MAAATTTTTPVQAVDRHTIREEVMDTIYNIDPIQTPLMSALSRGTCRNTQFDVLQDELADADDDNAIIQGADARFFTRPSATRVTAYTQKSDKGVFVSDTAQAVANYGYNSEL